MVIVEENREFPGILDAAGSRSGPASAAMVLPVAAVTNWYATAHPSLPNYLSLISGSTQGVTDDGTGYQFAGPTLVDQLSRAGISWGAYMDGMPSPCYRGASSGRYAKKHNPFMYFTGITESGQCGRILPLTGLQGQLAAGTAPDFIWVSPDLCHDGHDCPDSTAADWLSNQMDMVRRSPWYAGRAVGGAVIVTYDEGTTAAGWNGNGGGHIGTVVLSATARGNWIGGGNHFGTLRSLEEAYRLPLLDQAMDSRNGDFRALLPPG